MDAEILTVDALTTNRSQHAISNETQTVEPLYSQSTTASRSDPSSWATSPTVRINVEDGPPYFAHKALLTTYIPYYAGFLDALFDQGRLLEVSLDERESYVIDGLITWLYTGHLDSVRERLFVPEYVVTLYQLADKLLCTELMNAVMNTFRHMMIARQKVPSTEHLLEVSRVGLLDSKFGIFLIRQFVYCVNETPGVWEENVQELEDEDGNAVLQPFFKEPELMAAVFKWTIKYRQDPWSHPLYDRDCEVYEEYENIVDDADDRWIAKLERDQSAKKRKRDWRPSLPHHLANRKSTGGSATT